MKFVFFGTPQLSVDILEHLRQNGLLPSLVVTNPDRPQGRNLEVTPPPVKVWAIANNIPYLQPENPSDPDFILELRASSFELFVVVAYGSILPKELLAIPKHGSLNIHYSLLPKLRGASPIESAILQDERDTGVSILLLDVEMDHGPVVTQQKLELPSWPLSARELRTRSNELGAKLLIETIPLWVEGKIEAKPQDHSKATYTKKFIKADGEITLTDDPYKNFLKFQAFEGSIGTYFFYSPFPKGSSESASRGISKSSDRADAPTSFNKGGIRVIIKSAEYKDGKLNILRVVPEGKKEMDYEEFLRGVK